MSLLGIPQRPEGLGQEVFCRQVGLIDMSLLGIPQRPQGLGQEVLCQASGAHRYVLIGNTTTS